MAGPESNPSSETPPQYQRGEPVRVYVDREGGEQPEDDWEYRNYRADTEHEVAAKTHPEGGVTEFSETPKSQFDEWQREKAAQEAGRLITGAAAETTPEAERIVEQEEKAEEEAVQEVLDSWGSFDEEGRYHLLADPEELSRIIDVPANIIIAAAEHDIDPEYLLSARDNPYTARPLHDMGIEWGPAEMPASPETDPSRPPKPLPPMRLSERLPKKPDDVEQMPEKEQENYLAQRGFSTPEEYASWHEENAEAETRKVRGEYRRELGEHLDKVSLEESGDPFFYLEAEGNAKSLEVEDMADRIETNPASVRRTLKRPGVFLLGFERIPFIGRRTSWLLLARAMHRQELRERREKGLGKNYEDGLLRLGIPRTRRNFKHIMQQDEAVRVLRNKLMPWNSYEYKGPEKSTARRDLAESIHNARTHEEAMRKHKRILHPSVYQHAKFGSAYRDFKDSKKKAA